MGAEQPQQGGAVLGTSSQTFLLGLPHLAQAWGSRSPCTALTVLWGTAAMFWLLLVQLGFTPPCCSCFRVSRVTLDRLGRKERRERRWGCLSLLFAALPGAGRGLLLPCHGPPAPSPAVLHRSGCSWLFQGVKGETGLPGPAGLHVSWRGSLGCLVIAPSPFLGLTPLLFCNGPSSIPGTSPRSPGSGQNIRGLCVLPDPPAKYGTKAAAASGWAPCWCPTPGFSPRGCRVWRVRWVSRAPWGWRWVGFLSLCHQPSPRRHLPLLGKWNDPSLERWVWEGGLGLCRSLPPLCGSLLQNPSFFFFFSPWKLDLNYTFMILLHFCICVFVLEVALINGETALEQPGTLSLCVLGAGASPRLQHLLQGHLHPSLFSWLAMKRNEPLQSMWHCSLFWVTTFSWDESQADSTWVFPRSSQYADNCCRTFGRHLSQGRVCRGFKRKMEVIWWWVNRSILYDEGSGGAR